MDQGVFLAELARDGFAPAVTVEREAGAMDVHTHPFEACALILQGEIEITCEGLARRYQTGEVFRLAAGLPHSERYGPQGVRYLVGRK